MASTTDSSGFGEKPFNATAVPRRRTTLSSCACLLATALLVTWATLFLCDAPFDLDHILSWTPDIPGEPGVLLINHASAAVPNDGLTGRLPALGWNSWNEYGCNINESVFVTVGELLISTGLKDLGYEYVNIDDCWSDKLLQRDSSTKRIIPDYTKFPHGINHTADRIHDLGLKIGIYSDAGTLTCGGFVGSLGHEEIDAQTFSEWGIDYLKYDNCNVPPEWHDEYRWWPELWRGGGMAEDQSEGDPGETSGKPAPPNYDWFSSNTHRRYARMQRALDSQNRTIQYSMCAWGHGHVDIWGNATGQSWRMWGDIYPQWLGQHESSWGLMPILNHASFFTNVTNFWGHGDYDMLEVGNGDLTIEENRSHFALWAALKSPLIIGTPLDGIKPEILSILSNPALIAFNQDPVWGGSAIPYKWGVNPDRTWNQTHPAEFWVGPSTEGLHVFVLNTLDSKKPRSVKFAEIPGLHWKEGKKYQVWDMWTGEYLGRHGKGYQRVVAAHDTLAITIKDTNGGHPSPGWKPPKW